MTQQFAVFSEAEKLPTDKSRAEIDGGWFVDSVQEALRHAYTLHNLGVKLFGIAMLDTATGETSTHLNKSALYAMMDSFQKQDEREEAGEARHGTYDQQHRLTTNQVM